MANFIALYDSNVLYPAPLRNLLMHLAMIHCFTPKILLPFAVIAYC